METIKPAITDIPPVMTRKDLQEVLQISKNTALELLQTEQIDSLMVKGRYRIRLLFSIIKNRSVSDSYMSFWRGFWY